MSNSFSKDATLPPTSLSNVKKSRLTITPITQPQPSITPPQTNIEPVTKLCKDIETNNNKLIFAKQTTPESIWLGNLKVLYEQLMKRGYAGTK